MSFPQPLPYPLRMRKSPVEWILRGLYSVVLYLLLPITVYHLVWRGFRVREYFQRWDERYASYPDSTAQPRVWLHAVSVGEVNAAAPLVNALRQLRPDIRWVITTITPTGSERVRSLWGDAVDHEVCIVPGMGTYFARCKRAYADVPPPAGQDLPGSGRDTAGDSRRLSDRDE